jgi:hypothetical protein
MNFEIGEIVTWGPPTKIRKGIFKKEVDNRFSEVKCIEFAGRRFIIDSMVETKMLRKQNR